ncbi:RICIN domain-containing protein [Streptosporangium sp. NBC_01756]|uniref:RICIN domain-containing protein n=1 Tax=Streptosporangium sp. NBC_01756 TaxID=2975950 RepID=UPI002DD923B7|nr:RICIN domain-containing protein [Streptosporangium sp. NBC_01756]WSC85929.1 RICIN domain-containing protein [Streptosporangium sp. NBC_01756]
MAVSRWTRRLVLTALLASGPPAAFPALAQAAPLGNRPGASAAAGETSLPQGAARFALPQPVMLVNAYTGKCLTIAGGVSTENNVTALQYTCDDHPSRRWLLRLTGQLYG